MKGLGKGMDNNKVNMTNEEMETLLNKLYRAGYKAGIRDLDDSCASAWNEAYDEAYDIGYLDAMRDYKTKDIIAGMMTGVAFVIVIALLGHFIGNVL